MAASALIRNESGEILILKPTYQEGWLLPGGTIEEMESPREAAEREIREEIGLDIKVSRLLCVDYINPSKNGKDNMIFVFDGGVVTSKQITQIKLQESEICEMKFVPTDDISATGPNTRKRLPHCIQALRDGITLYLENTVPMR